MEAFSAKNKTLLFVVAALIAVIGVLGLMEVKNYARVGYQDDGDRTIIKVVEGLPAEAAGMQVGDQLLSVDGISLEDTKAWENQPRAKAGDTRKYVIERNGETIEMDITLVPIPAKDRMSKLMEPYLP